MKTGEQQRKWLDEDWCEPEQPEPPDPTRGMRRLALAVLLQAAIDFTKAQDKYIRLDAERFLFPANPDRQEDLRWTVEVSALNLQWLRKRLTLVREQTPPPAEFRTCSSCHQSRPAGAFPSNHDSAGTLFGRCRSCIRERRKAAHNTASDFNTEQN
jgi:hypothetical protein